MAFVTVQEDHCDEKVVGVDRYYVIGQEDAGIAEAAIVVEDRYQGLGLRTSLLKQFISHASIAMVHFRNDRIMQLIRRSGLPHKSKLTSGVREIQVALSSESPRASPGASKRKLFILFRELVHAMCPGEIPRNKP